MKESHSIARAVTALSHPRRVTLFGALEDAGPKGLGFEELLSTTGFGVTTLRHHLRPMQAAGLVVRHRKGVKVNFRLHGRAVKAVAEDLARRLSEVPCRSTPTIEPPPLN